MYKLIDIDEFMLTREVILENLNTGTVDVCFDDSELISKDNFGFIKVGEIYDCKIELFGDVVDEGGALCKIVDTNITIGNVKFIKILVEEDEYYIRLNELPNCNEIECFRYYYTRKDLRQVNDMVYADLLDKY